MQVLGFCDAWVNLELVIGIVSLILSVIALLNGDGSLLSLVLVIGGRSAEGMLRPPRDAVGASASLPPSVSLACGVRGADRLGRLLLSR